MSDDLDSFFEEYEESSIAQPFASDFELVENMKHVAKQREVKARLEAELKVVNKDIAEKQKRILDTYDARGITKMSVDGAGLFYINSKPAPTVKKYPEFLDWLDQRNLGSIARRTVHPQTLASWVKERRLQGNDLPPEELLAVFDIRTIRVRKG